jgi:hypothetical protein
VNDESLIDEMRAALRGDRDRAAMRQRTATPAPPAVGEVVQERAGAPVEERDAPHPASPSLVKRLLRRG